jgi:4-hydroxy-tetrahydrodipicolinate reductase
MTWRVATTRRIFMGKNKGPDESDDESDAASTTRSAGRRSFLSQASVGTGAAAAAIGGLANNIFPSPQVANAATAITTPLSSDDSSSSSPRVVLWGFGNQNKLMAKYLWEKKIPVVGVISHHDVGKDYGMLDVGPWGSGIQKKTRVQIVDEVDAAAMLAQTQPNVCIMCTRSTLADLKPALTTCATSKVNVITIAEELLFSGGSSPQWTKELDLLFKQNGVSVTGSGFIDGACCEMALALSSMMHRITGLQGKLQYNVNENGIVLAQAHGVGLSLSQFQTQIVENSAQDKSYVYNANEWFASAFGLTVIQTKEERKPVTASIPIYSNSMGKTIPVGDVTGMQVIATTTTKEGITIQAEQIGRCYEDEDEKDFTGWKFQGEPTGVNFSMDSPPTVQMTNTATISRIPQIIAAPPGYVTTDHFEIARYQHWS